MVLSGDVHYASTMKIHYTGDAPGAAPRRVDAVIAQLTSSAAKNESGSTKFISFGSYAGAMHGDRIWGWANPSAATRGR